MLEIAGCVIGAGLLTSLTLLWYEKENAAYVADGLQQVRQQLASFEFRLTEIDPDVMQNSRELGAGLMAAHAAARELLQAAIARLHEGELQLGAGNVSRAGTLLSEIEDGIFPELRVDCQDMCSGSAWYRYLDEILKTLSVELRQIEDSQDSLVRGDIFFLQDFDDDYLY